MKEGFLLDALIYLGAAVVMVPLSKKLGLGSVLGYLIAGILIGPNVLNFIGDGSNDVMHFAEFGVVMMLFLAGLEVDPATLWKWRVNIVGLGGLQVLLTTTIISFICHTFIGLDVAESLALGMSFSMSSTAIAMQAMKENKWGNTKAGRQAFSVLLFQDIAVIPILAVLPLLGDNNSTTNPEAANTLIHHLPRWAQTIL